MSPGERESTLDSLRRRCWDKALFAFGTAHIFEARSRTLRRRLRRLTFLGIGVPVTVGGIVLTFQADDTFLPYIILAAGSLGLLQLVGSTWALVADWDDELSYAVESAWVNHSLSARYSSLASDPPDSLEEFRVRFDLLDVENQQREQLDYKRAISESEKRAGHRAALRQFQRECITCKKVPDSNVASDCPTCGQFKNKGR